MEDATTLKDAIATRGPYAVWDLMTEDEQRSAAAALWNNADRETRMLLEMALAKDLKFRRQSVRKLPVDRIVGRLVRLGDDVPENLLFQYLFHFHMTERRQLLREFLDGASIPHEDGVLDLPEDFEEPEAAAVKKSAEDLIAAHGHEALVYLATLKIADREFWSGLDEILDQHEAPAS